MANVMPINDALVTVLRDAGFSRGGRAVCVFRDTGEEDTYSLRAVEINPGRAIGNHWTIEIAGGGSPERKKVAPSMVDDKVGELTNFDPTIPVFLNERVPERESFLRWRWILVDSSDALEPKPVNGKVPEARYNPT